MLLVVAAVRPALMILTAVGGMIALAVLAKTSGDIRGLELILFGPCVVGASVAMSVGGDAELRKIGIRAFAASGAIAFFSFGGASGAALLVIVWVVASAMGGFFLTRGIRRLALRAFAASQGRASKGATVSPAEPL